MSADCSVGSNPLAQLNKHAHENPALRRGIPQSSNGSAAHQFKTQVNGVSNANLLQMDQFMNRSPGLRDPQLGHMPVPPLMQSHSKGPGISSVNQPQRSNNWANEFGVSSNPSTNLVNNNRMGNMGNMGNTFEQVPNGNISSYRPGMTHMARPMMHTGVSTLQNYSHLAQRSQQPQMAKDENIMVDKQWDEQFEALEKGAFENLSLDDTKESAKEEIVIEDGYQAEFQEVWDKLKTEAASNINYDNSDSQWENDYARYTSGKAVHIAPYKFDTENQYMHNPNAYEIGCILMENGAKLSEAALAFEAAVQEDPGHVDAWLNLGLVQTQNEKELNGISALEQCLKLDPTNQEALMTISISYINEGYDLTAFSMLNRWLDSKYPNLVPESKIDENNIDRFNMSKQVITKFLQVANALPQVDPEVQLGLGTLFYANEEFDKTIDCFRAALEVNPNDELMWNRLGASLANSSRSEEAIQAYHKALTLKPSFVRARYNLAISSMNIGCYKEAAESLLSALSMHEVENVPVTGSVVQSNNILETLKRSFIAMDRRDLLEKVMPGMDLQQFRNEFNF